VFASMEALERYLSSGHAKRTDNRERIWYMILRLKREREREKTKDQTLERHEKQKESWKTRCGFSYVRAKKEDTHFVAVLFMYYYSYCIVRMHQAEEESYVAMWRSLSSSRIHIPYICHDPKTKRERSHHQNLWAKSFIIFIRPKACKLASHYISQSTRSHISL
jgi:hypothetical protein